MRAAEGKGSADMAQVEREVYQDRYLIRRPLLQALQAPEPGAVLLIDEVDRADEPFEAFLLEYLGEYQGGIAESVEWAKALVALDTIVVDPEVVSDTAGILFKQREDVAALTRDMAAQLLQPAEADA